MLSDRLKITGTPFMITRRIALVSLFVLTLASFGSPLSASTASANDPAQVFVEGMADEAIQALTAKGVTRAERIVRFRELLKANFDVPLIGKWVLGRYWKTASEVDKETYLTLFEDYVVIIYVERFDQYSGEKLRVVKSVAEPGQDALVFTEINRPTGGEPIRVNWRVRANSDLYKIIDVYVEGISMSQTQRKEFSSVLRSKGGDVAALNDILRTKVAELQ
jgi:phospholipid transport system substrate-binding protein